MTLAVCADMIDMKARLHRVEFADVDLDQEVAGLCKEMLRPGSASTVIELEVEGIGILRNKIGERRS